MPGDARGNDTKFAQWYAMRAFGQGGERVENAVNLSRTARERRFEHDLSVLTRLLAQISVNGLDRARKALYY